MFPLPINCVVFIFFCHKNHKTTLENLCPLNRSLLKEWRCSADVFLNMDAAAYTTTPFGVDSEPGRKEELAYLTTCLMMVAVAAAYFKGQAR